MACGVILDGDVGCETNGKGLAPLSDFPRGGVVAYVLRDSALASCAGVVVMCERCERGVRPMWMQMVVQSQFLCRIVFAV